MAEPKWTPGPWRAGAAPGGWDAVREPDGQLICSLNLNNPANMCLIAAAPELYEALADIMRVIATDRLVPESVSYMRQARAALAKAADRATLAGSLGPTP
jgi:hypothetical protein